MPTSVTQGWENSAAVERLRETLDEAVETVETNEAGRFVAEKPTADELFNVLKIRVEAVAKNPAKMAELKEELQDLWRRSHGPTAEAAAKMLDAIEDGTAGMDDAALEKHALLFRENVSFKDQGVVVTLDDLHVYDDLQRALRRLTVDALPAEAFETRTPGSLDPDEAAAVLTTVNYLNHLLMRGKAPGINPEELAAVARLDADNRKLIVMDLEKFDGIARRLYDVCVKRQSPPEALAGVDNVPGEEWDELTARGGARPLKRMIGHDSDRIRDAERFVFKSYVKEKLHFLGDRLKAVLAHSERRGTVWIDGFTFGVNATSGFIETMAGKRLADPVNLNDP
ncbi:MAG: hypothetical protein AAB692_02565, partial [Patescibacteria group bacterium]